MTHFLRHSYRVCLLAAVLFGAPGRSVAMTNADLLDLKMNGLLDETIMLLMDKQPGNYDTSPNALIKLKNGGLSDAVIQKVIEHANRPPSAETAATPAPPPVETAPARPLEATSVPPPPSEDTVAVEDADPPRLSASEPELTPVAVSPPADGEPLSSAAPIPPAEPHSPVVEDDINVEAITLSDATEPAGPEAEPLLGDPNLVIGADAAVAATGTLAPPTTYPVVGHTYFTRVTLRQEKRRHATTNYAVGEIVPVNTPVNLLSMKRNDIVLRRLDTGERLHIENIEKHTRRSRDEMAGLLLSSQRTPVEELPPTIATAIRNGTVVPGMTKEEVLMARGYPPGHATPSLAEDEWIYWESRRKNAPVVFHQGHVVSAGLAAE